MAASNGHGLVLQTAGGLIGVALMAILADMTPVLGRIMVTLMVGFVVLWMLVNVQQFKNLVGKL